MLHNNAAHAKIALFGDLLVELVSRLTRNLANFSRFSFPTNHFSFFLQLHVDFVENERVKKL